MIVLFPTEKWWFELPFRGVFKNQPSIYDEVFFAEFLSTILWNYQADIPASAPKLFPYKNFIHLFFLKKDCFEKVSYIFSPRFSGNGTFLYFLKKCYSYVSGKLYSDPGISRTRSTFRTLVYLERCYIQISRLRIPYSEHCETFTMERFAKIAQKIKKVLIFSYIPGKWNFLTLISKNFLYFL